MTAISGQATRFRRRFNTSCRACVLFTLVAMTLTGQSNAAGQLEVNIGFIGEKNSDAWYGAEQGIKEANAQGKFLGQLYTLQALDHPDQVAAGHLTAVVAAVSAGRLERLAELAADKAVFNVARDDNELREACVNNLLHTIPSQAMHDDAMQQWQRKKPGSSAIAQAWHPKFRKYAAAQLNKRYHSSAGKPMSDIAWAAWAAVKLTSDTVARTASAAGSEILNSVKTDLAFDGQKGIDMSFRNTGQLRQPLLLVENGEIVGEAPVRGIVSSTNLDSLGLSDCLK